MFCNNCGSEVNPEQKFCNKCGNRLTSYVSKDNIKYDKATKNVSNNKAVNNPNKAIPIALAILIIIIILGYSVNKYLESDNGGEYYFPENNIGTTIEDNTHEEGNTPAVSTNNNPKKGRYNTAIITDNVYTGVSISSAKDAKDLIVKDSVDQKVSDYPKDIIAVEDDIVSKYEVDAVNLKEMDVAFAKELEDVVKKIYDDFPGAKGYLTNLTLTNVDMTESGVIAMFMPIFNFAKSDSSTTRPWVIKTQVQLNAKFFLNPERLESATNASSKTGHFPPNSSRYSPVAHEFGHYLSFIALLNNYSTDSILIVEDDDLNNYYDIYRDFGDGVFSKQMLDEAYQNYISENSEMDFDEWRGQISGYALAKDESGDYIYDETIAEAFHDVYLNGDNANTASKYIYDVLKKHIGD